jgi:hypothetical protein
MAQSLIMTNANVLKAQDFDKEKQLLAFDDDNIYKLTLNSATCKILASKQLLTGLSNQNYGEIFNDYNNNMATGAFSHAEGQGTIAYSDHMHVQGKYNKTTADCLHVIGNGTALNPSDAYKLDRNGNGWFAGDVETASGASLNKLKTLITYGEGDPDPNVGNIGDIYCKIIKA